MNRTGVLPEIAITEEPGSMLQAVDRVRRLAPAVVDTELALLFVEDSRYGKRLLFCAGIVEPRVGWPCLTSPTNLHITLGPRLTIRVLGPGYIAVTVLETGEGPDLVLRGGRIKATAPYRQCPFVAPLFERIGKRQHAEVLSSKDIDESKRARIDKFFDGVSGHTMQFEQSWSRILNATIKAGHGGMFVILPFDVDSIPSLESHGIHCKYRSEVDVCSFLLEVWKACLSAELFSTEEEIEKHPNPACLSIPTGLVDYCAIRQFSLRSIERRIANLANVDGCVVLDARMSVRGFGCEIRRTQQDAKTLLRRFSTKETMPDGDIEQFGTRHRSACRLCQAIPGTIIFVVSQDGDLRIFVSDNEGTYRFDDLDVGEAD